MSDYIFIRKSRNILSTILHVVLNILLGFGSVFITLATSNWIFGIILVLISKWRIFAVRPRYWFLNIKSNLVDLIIGISFVMLAFYAGSSLLPIHLILGALYTVWLIWIKPLSSEKASEIQALIAVFLGTSTAALISANYNSVFMVLISFVVGYGASRHVLVHSSDHDFTLLTLICGLVCAEIAWLCHSWMIIYSFPTIGVIIPQVAIIMTIFAFIFNCTYKAIFKRSGKLKLPDIALPAIFSILAIAIIILWFSNPVFNV